MTTLASTVRGVLVSAPEVGPLHNLRRESVLFHQGQDSDSVFFIESGLVKLTRTSSNGSKQIHSVIGSQQLAGEECLAENDRFYNATAECLTDVAAFKVPAYAIKRLFGIPEIAMALVGYAVARDHDFICKIEMLVQHDVQHRILYGLAELARLVKPQGDDVAYPIPMTQAEIASFVGATRETTSTTLSQLQARKLVTLSRRLITTAHPDSLINAANDRMCQARTAG